ncbi:MAG TPA: mechanosensitive ion channel domain-containing protein [Streptosporangiaceae bacterium]|nr:mechanosensitive ion channel domain-containing protein [Streptosporangiaceae bacterium]
MEGYVVDTSWRNTTVRQLPNNIVIVPNATLAFSVVTSYHQPEQETSVSVPVGASYDSDLDHVERVTCEVASEVMRDVEGAMPTHEPFIRYSAFADSSINFSVILRAAEVTVLGVTGFCGMPRLGAARQHTLTQDAERVAD